MSLNPCVSENITDCATSDEVTEFYADNPKLQFLFVDKYFDIKAFDVLFSSYINTINYVSVDPAYLS